MTAIYFVSLPETEVLDLVSRNTFSAKRYVLVLGRGRGSEARHNYFGNYGM